MNEENKSAQHKRAVCIISGRVQMVMYRDFAQRNAKKMGIVGTVANEQDGTVRVIADGTEARLNEFIRTLRKGPLLSDVEDVQVTWSLAPQEFNNFTIVY